jgi:NDP-sugar pyrophosphorylase family protein
MSYFDIKDDLLVVSGDNLIDIDLKSIVEFHQKSHAWTRICASGASWKSQNREVSRAA